MSRRSTEEIALVGPPRNMTGVFSFDVSKSTVVPISISVNGDSTVYRAVLRPAGKGTSEIRLRLPVDTPAGVYTGEVTIDGKPRRVTLEIEALLRIRIQPKQTRLTATAKSSVEFSLTLMNDGNVVFDVPKADVFDLDDAVGQERALGKTLRATLEKGERGIDRYFDELRENHGGEARVTVRSGAGRLVPGETRQVVCLLEVPVTAKEGRSYTGPWHLGNTAHVIVADIIAVARPPVIVKTKVAPITATKAQPVPAKAKARTKA